MTEDQIVALIQKTLAEMLAAAPKQEEPAMSRAEFCNAEHMSLSTYHKMRKKGLGPGGGSTPRHGLYSYHCEGAARMARACRGISPKPSRAARARATLELSARGRQEGRKKRKPHIEAT